jgi:hypothetical protein
MELEKSLLRETKLPSPGAKLEKNDSMEPCGREDPRRMACNAPVTFCGSGPRWFGRNDRDAALFPSWAPAARRGENSRQGSRNRSLSS